MRPKIFLLVPVLCALLFSACGKSPFSPLTRVKKPEITVRKIDKDGDYRYEVVVAPVRNRAFSLYFAPYSSMHLFGFGIFLWPDAGKWADYPGSNIDTLRFIFGEPGWGYYTPGAFAKLVFAGDTTSIVLSGAKLEPTVVRGSKPDAGVTPIGESYLEYKGREGNTYFFDWGNIYHFAVFNRDGIPGLVRGYIELELYGQVIKDRVIWPVPVKRNRQFNVTGSLKVVFTAGPPESGTQLEGVGLYDIRLKYNF